MKKIDDDTLESLARISRHDFGDHLAAVAVACCQSIEVFAVVGMMGMLNQHVTSAFDREDCI